MPSLVRLKHRTHTDQHEQIYCTALTASPPAHLQCCEKGPPRVGEATGYAGPRRRRETHGEGPEGQDESIRGEHLARHPRNPGCPPCELQRHCSTPERSPRPTVAVEACTGAADSGSGGMRPSGQTQEPVALLTYDGEYGRVWNLHNDEEITAARVYRCRMSRTRSDMPCGRKTPASNRA